MSWKTSPLRMPLVLRGARQVGKSWLVREFSHTYEHFLEINFEREPDAKVIFEGKLDPVQIVKKLSIFCSGKPVLPEKSLIFLDEVQVCPEAIQALRYFKEELPEVHIVVAGSLIDFALNNIGLPVGRVEFLYLYPLSFGEFLDASGLEHLRKVATTMESADVVHEQLLERIKYYTCIGGMPAVVSTWLETEELALCQKMQQRVLRAYEQDFSKYATDRQIPHVRKVFSAIPNQLGQKFKYSQVDNSSTTYSLKLALDLLITAGVACPCYHSSANGLPLAAGMDPKKIKIFLFDIGLTQALLGLDLKDWLLSDIDSGHLGDIAEQFVAQELIAYSPQDKKSELFYWQRESKNSSAEVDFVTIKKGNILPLEVKSGKGGSMKSLRLFLEEHDAPLGVKVSMQPAARYDDIQDVPFYGIAWLLYSGN
jgi:predicted AAA+ superfamily ATPase